MTEHFHMLQQSVQRIHIIIFNLARADCAQPGRLRTRKKIKKTWDEICWHFFSSSFDAAHTSPLNMTRCRPVG